MDNETTEKAPPLDPNIRVAFINDTGSVSVIFPVPGYEGTQAEWLKLHKVLETTQSVILDDAELPYMKDSHNEMRKWPYFGAWKIRDGKVVHDMALAKKIHLNRIREAREPLLANLDTQYTIAARSKAGTAQLDKQRGELLALTDAVKNADPQTPEELYALWPAVLEKRN